MTALKHAKRSAEHIMATIYIMDTSVGLLYFYITLFCKLTGKRLYTIPKNSLLVNPS